MIGSRRGFTVGSGLRHAARGPLPSLLFILHIHPHHLTLQIRPHSRKTFNRGHIRKLHVLYQPIESQDSFELEIRKF